MAEIVLYQFPASHFNEKARWALDLKHVAHRRISLAPGPHAPRMKRLTGATQTPALQDGETVIPGSAAILEHLEQRFPEPPLLPVDPRERERALAIQREFDAEVGPAVRLAKFFDVMDAGYAADTFLRDRSAIVRSLYRAGFPVVHAIMRRQMLITSANADRARERTLQAFDFVAKHAGAHGHLVGERFSIADLTAAALLMPAVDVSAWGGPPESDSGRVAAWHARWSAHPGAEWVRETYRRHRRPRAETSSNA